MRLNGTNERVVVSGFRSGCKVESIRFSNGDTWSLATLEALASTLYGTAGNDQVIGQASHDRLFGLSGNDTLIGASGDDTLDGGAGTDTMLGNDGNDTYGFGRGLGVDTIRENDPTIGVTDVLLLAAGDLGLETGGLTVEDVSFVRSANNLEMLVRNSTDKLVFENWYLGAAYHVEEFRFSGGQVLTDLQAQALVGAMASFGAVAGDGEFIAPRRTTVPALDLAPATMW